MVATAGKLQLGFFSWRDCGIVWAQSLLNAVPARASREADGTISLGGGLKLKASRLPGPLQPGPVRLGSLCPALGRHKQKAVPRTRRTQGAASKGFGGLSDSEARFRLPPNWIS